MIVSRVLSMLVACTPVSSLSRMPGNGDEPGYALTVAANGAINQ